MPAGANYSVKLGAKVRAKIGELQAGANLGALRANLGALRAGVNVFFVFYSKLIELSLQNMPQIPYIFVYL